MFLKTYAEGTVEKTPEEIRRIFDLPLQTKNQ